MKGTHKHTTASLKFFNDHRCLSHSEESKCLWKHGKDCTTWVAIICNSLGAVFTMCSHAFTLFCSRKTSVIFKKCQWLLCVYVCFTSGDLFIFLIRVRSFYSYFCAICTLVLSLSTWFLLVHPIVICIIAQCVWGICLGMEWC